jgi:hypothetical protein
MTMYEDGRKTGGYEEAIEIVDVAELLVEALEAGGRTSEEYLEKAIENTGGDAGAPADD